jgi:tetratricopeptide (TPR) repeat protein
LRSAGEQVDDVSRLLSDEAYEGRAELLLNELWAEPNTAALRQQAAQETAVSWGTKGDRYIGVVTLLAVALTLLGLSLTVGAGVRAYLIGPAALILAGCLVATLAVFLQPPAGTPESAIVAVAEGDRLASNRDYDRAAEEYTRAIELDGDYVTAYQHRATARLLAGSPERDLNLFVFSSSSEAARRSAVEDQLRAIELGGADYNTLTNLGANYFHLSDYERTREFSQRAIEENPTLPLPWNNLTLGLAGLGRDDEAVATMAHAIELIGQRQYIGERRELYASARATLETLATRTPEREAIARRLQGMMVQAQTAMEAPTATEAPSASVTDLTAASNGSIVSMSMSVSSLPSGSLSPTATTVNEVPEQSNNLVGTARYVMLSPTEQGYVWVSLTAEGVLRATYARYPLSDPNEVTHVIQRTRYIYTAI